MFKVTTAIKKILNLESRIKVIQGGTSAGKTYAILAVLIDKGARYPGLEISVVSESIPHLRRGAIKDFLKIMKQTGRFNPDGWNKTHLKYEFANGSYIEFFSVDDESKVRGARRNILYCNEANNIKYEAYLQLSIRTNKDVYIDFNPTHKFWAHQEVLSEKDSELLILTYRDNEALEQSIIDIFNQNRVKAMRSDYWKNWCKVYLDGEVGSLEGVIFNNWSKIDKIPEEARLLGHGLDFGYTNDPTTLVAVYKYNEQIIVDEIIYRKGLSNSEISSLMKQAGVSGVIYADSAEPKSIAELRGYGHQIMGAKKGRDSINFGISILQEYEMLVTSHSHNLIDELNKYSWTKDKEGNTLNVPMDAFNDCIDALRYIAMMKLGNKGENKIRIMRH